MDILEREQKAQRALSHKNEAGSKKEKIEHRGRISRFFHTKSRFLNFHFAHIDVF